MKNLPVWLTPPAALPCAAGTEKLGWELRSGTVVAGSGAWMYGGTMRPGRQRTVPVINASVVWGVVWGSR